MNNWLYVDDSQEDGLSIFDKNINILLIIRFINIRRHDHVCPHIG